MDDDLDDLFTGLRARPAAPSDALMARVMADAAALQPKPVPRATTPRPGFWAGLAASMGGFGAVAGLATAAVAGLAIGLAAPTPADALTAVLWGDGTDMAVNLIPTFDEVLTDDGG